MSVSPFVRFSVPPFSLVAGAASSASPPTEKKCLPPFCQAVWRVEVFRISLGSRRGDLRGSIRE
eukprot:8661641-Pyramimonas_sp.AAC.1